MFATRSAVFALVGLASVAACSASSPGSPSAAAGATAANPGGQDASLPDATPVDAGDSPTEGPTSAKVLVVEFGDFECPYCGAEEPIVTEMLSDYAGRIRFAFEEFPLSQIHPYAELASEAALAANAQGKFWPYHDALYANQSALGRASLDMYASMLGLDMTAFDAALDNHTFAPAVAADVAYGESLGVDGTPTFFINGVRVVGAVPYSDLQAVIDQALAAE
jgi:protein-disulfide isomerase